ncbi:MAG: hypothetical protein ACRCXB_07420 [Aeromonadaceae bacterium]
MKTKMEMFESAMRKNGLYDNGSNAMGRCSETGGYVDSDTNAMWAGFLAAFDEIADAMPKCEEPDWYSLCEHQFGYCEGVNETLIKVNEVLGAGK